MGRRTNTRASRFVSYGGVGVPGDDSSVGLTQGGRMYHTDTYNNAAAPSLFVFSQSGRGVNPADSDSEEEEDPLPSQLPRASSTGGEQEGDVVLSSDTEEQSASHLEHVSLTHSSPEQQELPASGAPVPSSVAFSDDDDDDSSHDSDGGLSSPAAASPLTSVATPSEDDSEDDSSDDSDHSLPSPAAPSTSVAAPVPSPPSAELAGLGTVVWAATHLTLRDACSPAARRAIQGVPKGYMRMWWLEDVFKYLPDQAPPELKKTKGSLTAYFRREGGELMQVKERWRCVKCDAERNVDPKISGTMAHHTKHMCPP